MFNLKYLLSVEFSLVDALQLCIILIIIRWESCFKFILILTLWAYKQHLSNESMRVRAKNGGSSGSIQRQMENQKSPLLLPKHFFYKINFINLFYKI